MAVKTQSGTPKEVFAVRVSQRFGNAAREIAQQDDECVSTVLRRLLKAGLKLEQEHRAVQR